MVLPACKGAEPPPTETFYDRKIGPILLGSCANSPTQSGCHVAKDDRGNSLGNLNVTSYEALTKRSDLFISHGAYGVPALILKVLPPFQLRLSTWDQVEPQIIETDIPHLGGSLIDVTSTSYNELTRWIQRGASENNSIIPPPELPKGLCSPNIGDDPAFPPGDPTSADYAMFQSRVSPMLGERCAAGNCHGTPANLLYLTCGNTPEQARWNYFVAKDYVSVDPQASEILRRPLDPNGGGVYHEGGAIFGSTTDPDYKTLLDWAKARAAEDAANPPPPPPPNDPFMFFAHRVQPMLVKKGCMIIGCHAPAMGHEYRLRAGSGGQFGLATTRRNYALTLEQVALETTDVNVSRLLRKNLEPPVANSPVPQTPLGIIHRGGALFGRGAAAGADAGPADPPPCIASDSESGDLDIQPPYCVIKRWIELEHAAKAASLDPLSAVVYVKRTASAAQDTPQDFGTFAPGADLMRAPVTTASPLVVGGGTSLLGSCGLSPGIDVRRPAVSWDGRRIAFAARTSETEPYRIYVVDGATCAVEPTIDAPPTDNPQNELVHNFDPAFAPDGRIVFASTRGNIAGSFDYQGPQRTPADPSKLNSNLYVAENGTIRQLTFLLNQELTPSFMNDGRLVMTTEKRAKGFYQLAGRRQNLDGGDYHPLFGQRATFGFRQVTDIVELADKDFATILSNPGAAHGAGALAVVNRSIGVDQQSTEPADFTQDTNAVTWPNPEFYQHAVRIIDGVGTPGQGGTVYRNPTPLPNGKILVAAADVGDVASFSGNFDLYVVDPVTGERSAAVVAGPDDEIWPVAVYGRHDRGVFKSKLDEPNGATRIDVASGQADVTILDFPLLTSLLFQNTRSRRFIPDATDCEEWEDLPPEPGVRDYASGGAFVVSDNFGQVYVRRRLIGNFSTTDDGSAHVSIPGGVPLVLAPLVQLATDAKPTRHHQLEEMQFYPGEVVRQGFPRGLFNGVCASCHGAVSGLDSDIAANPDILTQASRVFAKDEAATPANAGGAAKGPPFP
jgi:hypothetical protein